MKYLLKLLNISEKFSDSATGMSFYDNMLSKENISTGEGVMTPKEYYKKYKKIVFEVVELTPDEYIKKVLDGFWIEAKSNYDNKQQFDDLILKQRQSNSDNIEKLKTIIQSGEMHMPVIEYYKNGTITQEGFHRAIAAKELNINKIPVLIVKHI